VVPRAEVVAYAHEWAKKLSEGPAFAHAMTKQMIEGEHEMSLEGAIEAEAQAQAVCMQHPDYREAYEAFVQRREPRFEGRPAEG
ncbi:MAG TPA: enoyl-CoA hydratase-related protein, partial [Pyrinomonadaceae bacterium]|nr:enoyl-CoA hydratase-related protein [Pyrinomonadaceae bacterium]